MGCTIKTSFCSRVTFSRRSPVAMSNGCAPVLASYSAITLFTSSMSAVAGSYSRSVVSPRDENVRILAFMLVSCGTFLFGFLWESTRQVWVPKGHIAPFLRVVKTAVQMKIASRFMGLATCGTGNTHRHLAPCIIEESKIYRPFRGRVIDRRKNRPGNFAFGLFTVCGNGVWPNSTRTIHVLLPISVSGSKQYCRCQAAECSRSLHSRQWRAHGTASKRVLEIGCLQTSHTP